MRYTKLGSTGLEATASRPRFPAPAREIEGLVATGTDMVGTRRRLARLHTCHPYVANRYQVS
jgi:hypothetical protein